MDNERADPEVWAAAQRKAGPVEKCRGGFGRRRRGGGRPPARGASSLAGRAQGGAFMRGFAAWRGPDGARRPIEAAAARRPVSRTPARVSGIPVSPVSGTPTRNPSNSALNRAAKALSLSNSGRPTEREKMTPRSPSWRLSSPETRTTTPVVRA
jgi:hypothetical protein